MKGIEEVTDPAGLFLSGDGPDAANAAPVEGTCGDVHIGWASQSAYRSTGLVTTSVLPTPRRAVNGVDPSRIAMLVAVLYRHSKLNLLSNDLYISTIAGARPRSPVPTHDSGGTGERRHVKTHCASHVRHW